MHNPVSHNCAIIHVVQPYNRNSTELHQQGVAPRSQYSDRALEAVTSTGHLYNHLFFNNSLSIDTLNQAQSRSEPNAIENVTDNNDYFIDVTNLGLHNKDSFQFFRHWFDTFFRYKVA